MFSNAGYLSNIYWDTFQKDVIWQFLKYKWDHMTAQVEASFEGDWWSPWEKKKIINYVHKIIWITIISQNLNNNYIPKNRRKNYFACNTFQK